MFTIDNFMKFLLILSVVGYGVCLALFARTFILAAKDILGVDQNED